MADPATILTEPPRLVTAEQLAAHLSVNRFTVYRWVERGQIPHVRLGTKTLRFELDAVLAAMRNGGAK